MWVSTFHSMCVRILRNQASLVKGLNSNFSIYDADDSRRLLMMIAKDMGLDTKRYSPRLLSNCISNLKNELIDPEQAAAEVSADSGDLNRIVADVYDQYQRRLRAANALDFDDLIGETVAVLQRFPQIAQYTGDGSGTSWSTSTRTPTTPSTCWCASWPARTDRTTCRPPSCASSATPTSLLVTMASYTSPG